MPIDATLETRSLDLRDEIAQIVDWMREIHQNAREPRSSFQQGFIVVAVISVAVFMLGAIVETLVAR